MGCPAQCWKVKERLSASKEGFEQAPVNGGRNYNSPKGSEIPCQVSSDPHERRNGWALSQQHTR